MNIHEYQAHQLFREYGISVPQGIAVSAGDDIKEAINALNIDNICVKAQIHSGGRGKGKFKHDPELSGVKVVNSKKEALDIAERMLGNILITKQTGQSGKIVNKIYFTEVVNITHEYYAAILLDRKLRKPVLILSTEGGMDIETVAKNHPEKINKIAIDPLFGLRNYQASEACYMLGLDKAAAGELTKMLMNLYKLFSEKDCSLVEINPLVMTNSGSFLALDAKINFDDNAVSKHPEVSSLRDISEENPKEVEASKYNLNYIALDGNIACLVNGAGLAMATMDIIKHYGGEPANFLDIGGGAGEEQITHAFQLILKGNKVKGILVNIFGGIVKCDVVAQGIINAAKSTKLQLPLVVRLEGTNVDKGKQLLKDSQLEIVPVSNLDEAAKTVVSLSK